MLRGIGFNERVTIDHTRADIEARSPEMAYVDAAMIDN